MTEHPDQLPGSYFGPSTLVDLIRHRAAHQDKDVALTYLVDGENEKITVTYGELDRRARAIAVMLQEKGLEGQRALLLYPAGLDFLASFFGCMYAGVVAVPAYPPRRNRKLSRIESIVSNSGAKIALMTDTVLEQVLPVLDQTPDLMEIEWTSTDNISNDQHHRWQAPDIHTDTMAFLQYTSGSTGEPKGVMVSHANLIHNAALIAESFEVFSTVHGLFWLPTYHDMGLIGGVLVPLYVGGTSTLMSPMSFLQRPVRWLQAISRMGAMVSGGPNFAYDLCVDKIKDEQKEKLDLSNWGLAFNGAEPVRQETIDRFSKAFEQCGFRRDAFYPCYGMAETTLMVTGGRRSKPPVFGAFDAEALQNDDVVEAIEDDEDARLLVSSGTACRDHHIIIADPETCREVKSGRVGEIWVTGPSVAQGYWRNEELTDEIFHARTTDTNEGPYLRTGDLGFLHDRELYVTGRLKDLIIVRGANHYPQDIELTAEKSHSRLRKAGGAAFTVESDGHDRLYLVHEIERRRQGGLDEVFEAIRRDISAEHQLAIDAIVLVKAGSIPKTSSGKIQRRATRDVLLADELTIIAEWGTDGADAATIGPMAVRTSMPAPESNVSPPMAAMIEGDSPALAPPELRALRLGEEIGGASEKTLEIVMEKVRGVARERATELTAESNIVELGLDSLERMEVVAEH